MIYYIYRTTNKLNGKTYIGQRSYKGKKVECDTYIGSGKLLMIDVKKYGKESFCKNILYVAENIKELLETEKQMISIERSIGKSEYNLHPGGSGGHDNFSHNINIRYIMKQHQEDTRINKEKEEQKQRNIIVNNSLYF